MPDHKLRAAGRLAVIVPLLGACMAASPGSRTAADMPRDYSAAQSVRVSAPTYFGSAQVNLLPLGEGTTVHQVATAGA